MDQIGYERLVGNRAAHWWNNGRRAVLEGVMSRHLETESGRRVLEIGAGAGANIEMLSRFGTVDAVEMDDTSREALAALHPGIEVRNGALPDAEVFSGKKYDVVAMFDVLEHVAEEREALSAVRAHTAPGGSLVITVPAYEWLWSQMDVLAHHQRRYTRARLREALEGTGWAVRHLSHFNTLLFPLAVAARVKDKLTRSENTTGLDMPSPVINTLFSNIFASERRIVTKGGFPFGLSIVAVATPGGTQ